MPEEVLTLTGLDRRRSAGISLAVLGFPVVHSISPPIHNAALAEMARIEARFADWRYHRMEVESKALPEALPKLADAGFRGLNLTIPHKVRALDLVVDADAEARAIGAVNTLLASEDGWRGFNTDGYGLEFALREDLGVELEGSRVVLIGAGGAARAAATRCLARRCGELWIGNRSPKRLERLLADLPEAQGNSRVEEFSLAEPPENLPREGVVVLNATALGLLPDDGAPLDLSAFSRDVKVYDMIYNPPETALLAQARSLGMPAANGLSMLVHQAARSLEIWSGAEVPVEPMFTAARATLN